METTSSVRREGREGREDSTMARHGRVQTQGVVNALHTGRARGSVGPLIGYILYISEWRPTQRTAVPP